MNRDRRSAEELARGLGQIPIPEPNLPRPGGTSDRIIIDRNNKEEEVTKKQLESFVLYSKWTNSDETIEDVNTSLTSYCLVANKYCFLLPHEGGEFATLDDCFHDRVKGDHQDSSGVPPDSNPNAVRLYYIAKRQGNAAEYEFIDDNCAFLPVIDRGFDAYLVVRPDRGNSFGNSILTRNLTVSPLLQGRIAFLGEVKWSGKQEDRQPGITELTDDTADIDTDILVPTNSAFLCSPGYALADRAYIDNGGDPLDLAYQDDSPGWYYGQYAMDTTLHVGSASVGRFFAIAVRIDWRQKAGFDALLSQIEAKWLPPNFSKFEFVGGSNVNGCFGKDGDNSEPDIPPVPGRSELKYRGRKEEIFLRKGDGSKEIKLPLAFRTWSTTPMTPADVSANIPQDELWGRFVRSASTGRGTRNLASISEDIREAFYTAEDYLARVTFKDKYIYAIVLYGWRLKNIIGNKTEAQKYQDWSIRYDRAKVFKIDPRTLNIIDTSTRSYPQEIVADSFWFAEVVNSYFYKPYDRHVYDPRNLAIPHPSPYRNYFTYGLPHLLRYAVRSDDYKKSVDNEFIKPRNQWTFGDKIIYENSKLGRSEVVANQGLIGTIFYDFLKWQKDEGYPYPYTQGTQNRAAGLGLEIENNIERGDFNFSTYYLDFIFHAFLYGNVKDRIYYTFGYDKDKDYINFKPMAIPGRSWMNLTLAESYFWNRQLFDSIGFQKWMYSEEIVQTSIVSWNRGKKQNKFLIKLKGLNIPIDSQCDDGKIKPLLAIETDNTFFDNLIGRGTPAFYNLLQVARDDIFSAGKFLGICFKNK